MDNEIIKMSDDIEDFNYQSALINQTRNSYISKEEFIQLISKMNFDRIKSAQISFITGYKYIPEDEKYNEHVNTLGFEFNIN